MSFRNGFNKGFSLGLAGRIFNRGFSTKILSIQRLSDIVEEIIDTSIITETNHRIDTIEHNVYTVDFVNINGNGYIIFEASPSQFPNTLVTFNRIDTNTNAVAQIVNYTGGNQYYYIDVGESFTFYSDGSSWTQTTSDGATKVISHTNYFVSTLDSLQQIYIIDQPSNLGGISYTILSAQAANYANYQITFNRIDDNTNLSVYLIDQQTGKSYIISAGSSKTLYSYNGVWNETPPGIIGGGIGGGDLGGGGIGGGGLIGP